MAIPISIILYTPIHNYLKICVYCIFRTPTALAHGPWDPCASPGSLWRFQGLPLRFFLGCRAALGCPWVLGLSSGCTSRCFWTPPWGVWGALVSCVAPGMSRGAYVSLVLAVKADASQGQHGDNPVTKGWPMECVFVGADLP